MFSTVNSLAWHIKVDTDSLGACVNYCRNLSVVILQICMIVSLHVPVCCFIDHLKSAAGAGSCPLFGFGDQTQGRFLW